MRLKTLIYVLAFTGLCAGLFGTWLGSVVRGAECASDRLQHVRDQLQHAREQWQAAEASSVQLLDAQERADVLTRNLWAARRAAETLRKERDDAIATVTTGRECLDAAALGVLDGAPGLRVNLPEAAGGADGANAGVAATDTDLGRWALAAGEQYAECRRRYQALIDWHERESP